MPRKLNFIQIAGRFEENLSKWLAIYVACCSYKRLYRLRQICEANGDFGAVSGAKVCSNLHRQVV